ncbi:MAG TPA: hypothetical protein PLX50_07150 [Candidatus Aminicenantes bacterium]|nr:hypothetical protein [Candidatus Aminicenantes bacterium]
MGRHRSGFHKFGIGLAQPRCNLIADFFRQKKHLLRFLVGRDPGPFVPAEVSLFPELIELGDQRRRRGDCMNERLDDPIVMRVPRDAIAGRGKAAL